MANNDIDWAAVFIGFCRGASVEELCAVFTVAESTLNKKIYEERWHDKRKLLLETFIAQAGTLIDPDQLPDQGGEMLAQVLANREANYIQAQKLRVTCDEMLERVAISIRGPSEEQDDQEKQIRAMDVEGGQKIAATLKSVAGAIATAQDLSYRALGDLKPVEVGPAGKSAGGDDNRKIVVSIPGAISKPRKMRSLDAKLIE